MNKNWKKLIYLSTWVTGTIHDNGEMSDKGCKITLRSARALLYNIISMVNNILSHSQKTAKRTDLKCF